MRIVEFEDNRVNLLIQDNSFLALKKRDTSPNKSRFYKEMLYIYNVADYNGRPHREGYNEIETHKYALEAAGLDDTFILDKLIRDAIISYFDLRDTASIKYIRQLLHAMNNGIKVVQTLNEVNDELLEKLENTSIDTELALREKALIVGEVAKNQKLLFDLASESETQVEKLKKLYDKLRVEEEKSEKGMGDDPITSSMIPD